ncbi:hypothetical protein JCM11251_002033 [Rhodosporidiobolus azoricus]
MDGSGAPIPSMSAAGPAAGGKRRGPAPQSCESCRYRRVKCVRANGPSAPCEQCLKKGIACTAVQLASPAPRSGKRIETAKQLYGSLPHSSSSSTTINDLSLVPSGLSARLADMEMSETLGLELLTLYGDAGRSCCQPLFPPPVLDYIALRDRYRLSGRRFSDMSAEDQLTGRIVFATAARLWSTESAPTPSENRHLLAKQLLVNAQTRADLAAVWRHPSPDNAVSLLLLYQLINRGEISSEEAKPYLAALVGHLRALNRTNPELLLGASGSNTSALVWCLMAFDAFAAVERAEEPIVSNREYERLLRPLPIDLPSIAAIRFALSSDPWSLTNYLLVPLGASMDVGRRLARCLDELETRDGAGGMTVAREMDLAAIWRRANEVCTWGKEVLEVGEQMQGLDIFTATVLHMYVSLAYGSAVFLQLALVLYLEKHPQDKGTFLSQLEKDHPQTVAQYLRSIRVTATGNNFLTVFTGTAWSVSRLVIFSQSFLKTSAWNPLLHPAGMTDKLSSLYFLHDTLTSVERSYPSEDLAKVIKSVEAEQASIQVILGSSAAKALPNPALLRAATATPSEMVAKLLAPLEPATGGSPSGANTLSRPSTDSSSNPAVTLKPSLFRISTWTHILDKEERPAAEYYSLRDDLVGEQLPRPKRSPPQAENTGSSASDGSGIFVSNKNSPPNVPPGVTWEDIGFDFRPAPSAGAEFPPPFSKRVQHEPGAFRAVSLHARDFRSAAADSFGDRTIASGDASHPPNLDFFPFLDYQPSPIASTIGNSSLYSSSTPLHRTAPAVISRPHTAALEYTGLPPGTAVYPYPPSAALPGNQNPFPAALYPSAFSSSAPPVPAADTFPHPPTFPFIDPSPDSIPAAALPFYTSTSFTAGFADPPQLPTPANDILDAREGCGAESNYLASFLATLVNEAGPSPPRRAPSAARKEECKRATHQVDWAASGQ